MSLFNMPCVIFAGGKSSRMQQDKAFLPFGEYESLIQYQVTRLEKIFKRVYISAKDKNKFKTLETTVIEDIHYHDVFAPSAGFFNTFAQLKEDNAFFIISVDTPFVNKHLISSLIEASTTDYEAIILRTPSRVHPLCGIYTRALQKPIQDMLEKDNHKLMYLLKNSNVKYIDVEDEKYLLNLNTPEQYQGALKIYKNLQS